MKLTLGIMCYNQLGETKAAWGCFVANTVNRENVELVIIDNNCTDGTVEFLERFVFPFFPDHKLIHNDDNIGVIPSMNQIYRESTGDVIAIIHNDVFIYEYGWNTRVMDAFEQDSKLGLAGFIGAYGIMPNGGRLHTVSNLLEAEIHGDRFDGIAAVSHFDGLALIARRTMLDDVSGFDESYAYHHFYDRDISLSSHFAGWTNKVIGIYCHHWSGITANRSDYAAWIAKKMGTEIGKGDQASYNLSEMRFFEKWKDRLPFIVSEEWG